MCKMKVVVIITVAVMMLLSACATQTPPAQPGAKTLPTPVQQLAPTPIKEKPVASPPPAPQPKPMVQEFSVEADDRGFYMDGKDVNSIAVQSGSPVKLLLTVRSNGVYYSGLDFSGCDQRTVGAKPGGTAMLEFVPSEICTITSYWPSTGRIKDTLQIRIAK